MSTPGRRPTLKAVAEAAGVSISTVSNVYNRPGRVSQEARARVLAAAERLGFTGPDAAAGGVRRGRTGAVGLVFTDELAFAFEDQASVGFLAGLASGVAGSRHHLVLLSAGPPDGATPSAAQPVPRSGLDTVSVDGLIVYSVPDDDADLRSARSRGLPVVVVDQPRVGPDEPAGWVGIDDRSAMAQLAGHLLAQGHHRIGVITSRLGLGRRTGPFDLADLDSIRYAVQRDRLAGLLDAVGHAGVEAELVVHERYDATYDDGAVALHDLLERRPDLTAVCALADVLAIGALQAARARGLTVPGQLSITGFDDIPEAARVGLTTVHQPLADKGRAAAELLQRSLDRAGGGDAGRVLLPTVVHVRTSTGPASDRESALTRTESP